MTSSRDRGAARGAGIVSAAGVTRERDSAVTIENPSAFDPASTKLRLVIVGGLDGDQRGARAVLERCDG